MPDETAALTLEELVDSVNRWCVTHNITPANGQSADELSTRTLRYYRTMGLLSAPTSGAGNGYGEIHRLQLSAIRVLQAQGLPLRRIQTALYGRKESELANVLEAGINAAVSSPARVPLTPYGEDWRVQPLDDTVWLVLRNGRRITPEQLARIHAVLNGPAAAEPKIELETQK